MPFYTITSIIIKNNQKLTLFTHKIEIIILLLFIIIILCEVVKENDVPH